MWMRCRIRDTCSCSQTCLPRCCRFQVGLSVGLVAAILATVGIAVVYIPSLVSTVLKFRSGVFANLIYDINSTHFTDGSNIWPYTVNSHNGTHVFDKFFPYNASGFSDGTRFFPYTQYATNGTHMTNGDYLFDGYTIKKLPGNDAVNDIEDWE